MQIVGARSEFVVEVYGRLIIVDLGAVQRIRCMVYDI